MSYDSLVICDQLGSSDGVQDETITENLQILEDRVSKLLTLQSYLHFQENLSQWVCGHETPHQWRVEIPSQQPVQTRCRRTVFSISGLCILRAFTQLLPHVLPIHLVLCAFLSVTYSPV